VRAVLAAGAVALALSACALPWGELKVSGEITVAPTLAERVPTQNSVLFIVAKNLGGMPVAVRRIVNPQFPVAYELTKDDVLIPGYRPKGPMRVFVEMNTHGNVGAAIKGDFVGDNPDTISARQSRVHVVIDRQL
jgi:hypothetical protein